MLSDVSDAELQDSLKELLCNGSCTEARIVAHLADGAGVAARNEVDTDDVPVPHFGIVLPMDEWQTLADRVTAKGVKFVIEPKVRFHGEVGEQATMFFMDPSGNALEFKSFADFSQVFARDG